MTDLDNALGLRNVAIRLSLAGRELVERVRRRRGAPRR
jgi:hypothetical protein